MTTAGITGHQHLGSDAERTWIRKQIETLVHERRIDFGITSLAIGSDQLFATVLLARSIPFRAVIPCRHYEQTFDAAALEEYRSLLELASEAEVLDFAGPSEKAFYEAGKTIVDMSDLMIAVWDGKPAKGLGGTADVVNYAQEVRRPVLHINLASCRLEFLG